MINLTGKTKLLEDLMSTQGKKPHISVAGLQRGSRSEQKARVISWESPKEKEGLLKHAEPAQFSTVRTQTEALAQRETCWSSSRPAEKTLQGFHAHSALAWLYLVRYNASSMRWFVAHHTTFHNL